MSLAYLPDQVQEASIALDLAERAVNHLRYSYQTLYEHSIDQAWVEQLASTRIYDRLPIISGSLAGGSTGNGNAF